jgi:hypothetical protein
MHMILKGQLDCPEGAAMSAAEQFYSLAGQRQAAWPVKRHSAWPVGRG